MNRLNQDQSIYEEQTYTPPKQLGMFSLNLAERKAQFEAENGKGIEYEFQELGKKLEKFYGKRIWAVFCTLEGTEANVKKAHAACVRYGKVGNFAYFRGVLKKL